MQWDAAMSSSIRTVGEIAAAQPAATSVFLRHKIDFCCGGQRSLDDACRRAGVDPAMIARELDEAAARATSARRWEAESSRDLVEHIEMHYHAALRRDVPPLIEAARKVERVHADKPAAPIGLAEALETFWGEMQAHMRKEEQILFPMLVRGDGAFATAPIHVMETEHDAHAVSLARIRALTGQLETPPHACATWRALYAGLRTLEAELMQHIHLENNVLFARAKRSAS
jgi:regulator of cell morphogenesis and NO signaling